MADRWGELGAKTGDTSVPTLPSEPAAPTGGDRDWSAIGAKNIDPLTGLPPQSMGAGDASPVSRSMQWPISEANIPGVGTQAAGSMATDPEQRRRIIAAQLFPTLNPLDAQSRVFFGTNGRMAAVGPDGKAFYVDPSSYAPTINQPRSLIPDNPLERAGTLAGPALPAVGGVAGGMIAAPESLILGPVGAAVGAAAGDVARQTIARQLDPGAPGPPGAAPTPQPYNWGQTGAEAFGAGTGQLVGGSLLRLRPGYNPIGANPLDRTALRDPTVQQRIADNYARARAQGVELTPGQASGLPSVINAEDVFASGSLGGEGANVAKAYYDNQRNQLTGAFDQAQGRVSPAADKTDAALQFQQGADDAQRIVRQQANAAAKPSYDAAKAGGQVMSPDLAQLHALPAVQDALKAAAADYHNLTGKAANLDAPDFELWDLAKRKLDDAVGTARKAGEHTSEMTFDDVRKRLVGNLDNAYPTYATARETAAPGLREAARLADVVGRGGEFGTEKLRAILNPVFESSNPQAIKASRDTFIKAGREDEWNAGTRAYVQDLFDATVKSKEGLNPEFLRRQIWSDTKKRDAIQAAMDPVAFQGLENLMLTVEDVAKSRGANSATAGRQAGASEVRAQAADTPGVKAVGVAKNILDPVRAVRMAGTGLDMLQGWMTKRNISNIGEKLFSPEGQKYLRSMANAPRGSGAAAATARFFGEQGGAYATAPPPPPPDPRLQTGNALEMPR